MRYDPSSNTLGFTSDAEAEDFQAQLNALVRQVTTQAIRRIEDEREVKRTERELMHEYSAVLRALNMVRGARLPHAS